MAHDSVDTGGKPRSGRLTRRERFKALPVFPTLLTSGNLACGVTAILCAASHHDLLFAGAVLVFAAMVFDMFDGKVARMTGTDGAFGAELDSLADIISFGVAPAMLVHRIVLGDQPDIVWGEGERLIWLLTVFYGVLTAIRLARYNVEHSEGETRNFRGLPSPGAAAMLCAWVMLHAWLLALDGDQGLRHYDSTVLAHVMSLEVWTGLVRFWLMSSMVVLGILMISTMPFPHIGNTILGGRMGIRRFILLLLVLGLAVTEPLYAMAGGTTAYILYGLIPGVGSAIRSWRQESGVVDGDASDEPPDVEIKQDAPPEA